MSSVQRRGCTGVILAGGAATRFGGAPKGLAAIGGERVIDRVAAALAGAADSLLLVANAPDAPSWRPDIPCIADRARGLGPLGGIQSALAHARQPILVVAWDMPFVPTSLLRALRARGDRGARAVVPAGPDGIPEPLCAWYSDSLSADVEALLDSGERRAAALAATEGAVVLDVATVASHGDPSLIFSNVNTPEDLRRADALHGSLP